MEPPLVPIECGGEYQPPSGILLVPQGSLGVVEGGTVADPLPAFGDLDEIVAHLERPALVPLGATHAARAEDSQVIIRCSDLWVAPEVNRRLAAGVQPEALLPIWNALVVFPPRSAPERHRVLLNGEVRIVADATAAYQVGGRAGGTMLAAEALDIRRLSFDGVDLEREGFLWIRADGHSHLGRVTRSLPQTIDFVAGTLSSDAITFTAADGDVLRVGERGTASAPGPGGVTFSVTLHVQGGTGRFAHASGEAAADGAAEFITNTGFFTVRGWIAYDASAGAGE